MTHEDENALDALVQRRLLFLLAKHYPKQVPASKGQSATVLFWALAIFALGHKQPARFLEAYGPHAEQGPHAEGAGVHFWKDDAPAMPANRALLRGRRLLVSLVVKGVYRQGESNTQ